MNKITRLAWLISQFIDRAGIGRLAWLSLRALVKLGSLLFLLLSLILMAKVQ